MTEPPEHLADPTHERLADPTELPDRPPAEFSPRALAIIWAAAIVGLVVSVCALVMVIAWRMALP